MNVALIAITARQRDIIGKLTSGNAFDMASAIILPKSDVKFIKRTRMKHYVLEENGKYWLNRDAYEKAMTDQWILVLSLLGVAIITVLLTVWLS